MGTIGCPEDISEQELALGDAKLEALLEQRIVNQELRWCANCNRYVAFKTIVWGVQSCRECGCLIF